MRCGAVWDCSDGDWCIVLLDSVSVAISRGRTASLGDLLPNGGDCGADTRPAEIDSDGDVDCEALNAFGASATAAHRETTNQVIVNSAKIHVKQQIKKVPTRKTEGLKWKEHN